MAAFSATCLGLQFSPYHCIKSALSNEALKIHLGIHILYRPPLLVSRLLESDRIGVFWPRRVQICVPSLKLVSVGWTRNGFPSLRTSGFRVCCAAKPETVQKVSEIVRNQLALSPEIELTPQSKFSELGADSLDTVEIVMGLEEEFDISVEEESSENITTIQEAAELIEKLVFKKSEA